MIYIGYELFYNYTNMIIGLKEIEIANTGIGYMMKSQLEKEGIIKILPVFDNEEQAISVCGEGGYIIY